MLNALKNAQHDSNRTYNRQSMALSEYGEHLGDTANDDETNGLLELTNTEKKKDRLDYFTKDSDYYTTLLLLIVKQQSDAGLPPEIVTTLEPVREKC